METLYILTTIWPHGSVVSVYKDMDYSFSEYEAMQQRAETATYIGLSKLEYGDCLATTLCEVFRNA